MKPSLKYYPDETAEQIEERERLGLVLTPYRIPEDTEEDRAMAWELLGRYITETGAVHSKTFGGDCVALGRMLGAAGEIPAIRERAKAEADRLFYEKAKLCFEIMDDLARALGKLDSKHPAFDRWATARGAGGPLQSL